MNDNIKKSLNNDFLSKHLSLEKAILVTTAKYRI